MLIKKISLPPENLKSNVRCVYKLGKQDNASGENYGTKLFDLKLSLNINDQNKRELRTGYYPARSLNLSIQGFLKWCSKTDFRDSAK